MEELIEATVDLLVVFLDGLLNQLVVMCHVLIDNFALVFYLVASLLQFGSRVFKVTLWPSVPYKRLIPCESVHLYRAKTRLY